MSDQLWECYGCGREMHINEPCAACGGNHMVEFVRRHEDAERAQFEAWLPQAGPGHDRRSTQFAWMAWRASWRAYRAGGKADKDAEVTRLRSDNRRMEAEVKALRAITHTLP